jgi:hypothetical protein
VGQSSQFTSEAETTGQAAAAAAAAGQGQLTVTVDVIHDVIKLLLIERAVSV